MFQITYSKNALKFLKRQSKSIQKRIIGAIEELPFKGDIKRLKGLSIYRLRVGDYRILFDVNYNVIDIIKIDNRGQVYKGV